MTARARIAIIGTGWWSTFAHIPALQANPAAELVALCDRDEEKLRRAAEVYGVERTYTSHLEMIAEERPDGIIIATPHATHFELARDCLRHSLHVLIEKPMTLYATHARELVETARSNGREIIIGYTSNYHPHALRAREIMQSGVLGRPQFVVCTMVSQVIDFLRGDKPALPTLFPVHGPGAVYTQPSLSGGGQGHLQLTHVIGLLLFVTGLRARRVFALMNNHGLALDLVDAMTVEFEGGVLGTVGGSGNAFEGRLSVEVHCERGSLVLDLAGNRLSVRGADGTNEEHGVPLARADVQATTSQNLVDVILGQAVNGAPGEVGWRTVELLDAAYRSAKQDGAPIMVASLYA